MSERPYLAQRMCRSKKKHRSDIAAFYAAINASQQLHAKFDHYKCLFCEYWHIGKDSRAQQKASG